MNETTKHEPELLLNGARGIYIPRDFVDAYNPKEWHLSAENIADLSDPDNEYYWDAWNTVLTNAYCYHAGAKWTLWQDSDLWAIPEDFDMEKEGWVI